jgi:hypothetical protein
MLEDWNEVTTSAYVNSEKVQMTAITMQKLQVSACVVRRK